MDLALRSFGAPNNDANISFLVVASSDLCEKISEGLFRNSRKRKCRVVVHQTESIVEVIRLKPELSVDFVVFAFDWQVRNSISEVEANIRLIDEHFIASGCTCLVNCAGVPQPFNLSFAQARKISEKLNLLLLTRNIVNAEDILSLGDALLNFAEARVGVKIGVPMLPTPSRIEQ